MGNIITNKQKAIADKAQRNKTTAAVVELKKLLKMPEVKDIIDKLVLGTTPNHELRVTRFGLEEYYQHDARPGDYMDFDESYSTKINIEYLAKYVESYNLTAADIIGFQNQLK